MTDTIHPAMMSPNRLAETLQTVGWWGRLRGTAMMQAAATRLIELAAVRDDLHQRLAAQERTFNKERVAYQKEAKSLLKRTLAAIEELEKYKGNYREEKAFAVILSPSQYSELTCDGYFRQSKIAKLDIYVARGVYGPVVLTENGFKAVSRNAPELNLVSKRPTKESNW